MHLRLSDACGTVFKITPAGKLTTLYNFCSQINCADGGVPYAGLTQGIDGSFYGATTIGGIGPNCPYPGGCGTLFRLTPADELTTLYNFCSQTNCTDGSSGTGMIQATDGDFYGTTGGGGANGGGGTVFRITPSGKLSTLHSFCGGPICADGTGPGPPSYRPPTVIFTVQRLREANVCALGTVTLWAAAQFLGSPLLACSLCCAV